MPRKPPRRCACGHITPADQRCPCQAKQDQARKRAFDQTRPSARERGYDADWQKARVEFLSLNPTCRYCRQAAATVIHHIQPHRGNMALFWNRANWFPACKPCHDGPLQSQERRKTDR